MSLVELALKRNRGWPWPEDSYGLSPMFGEDGWCRSCGTPTSQQSGSLVLQSKGMSKAEGAWVPHWLYDIICVSGDLARIVGERFDIELRKVEWHGKIVRDDVFQIVAPTSATPWFDEQALKELLVAKHGVAGAACTECKLWRWMPLESEHLPMPSIEMTAGHDVVASPEWFGDGFKSFRQLAFAPALGELIASASPRDFAVRPWA